MSTQEIVRAWKDEEYRLSLSGQASEQLLSHPIGFIDLDETALTDVVGGRLFRPIITRSWECRSMDVFCTVSVC